jgi:hypothetical protein
MSASYPDPIESVGGVLIINVHEDGALAAIPLSISAMGQVINAAALTLVFRVKANAFSKVLGAHPTDPMGRSLSLTKAEAESLTDNAAWVIFDETVPTQPVDQLKGVIRKYR